MLIVKNNKLIALDENDQKIIINFLEHGGTRILYKNVPDICPMLTIINSKEEEIGSLAGFDALFIIRLTGNRLSGTGMKLCDFIDNYCPNHNPKYSS